MSEKRDDFERDLARKLRAWTDVAERRGSWADEAQEVLAAAGASRGRSRWTILALGMGTITAILAGLVVVSLPNFFQTPSGSLTPTDATSTSLPTATIGPLTATPGASVIQGEDLRLSEIAWWDQLSIGFGIIPEFTPEPNPAVPPAGFRQVRIGTLDGRVTAVLAVHDDWGHSKVSGPVNGKVLVVNDNGAASSIRSVTATTGEIEFLHLSEDLITAAALDPSGDAFYYARVDRATMSGGTVWRRDLASGDEAQVDTAPDGFGTGDVDIWDLLVASDGRTLIAQYCFGEVRCTTRAIDVETGAAQETDAIGWVQGLGPREMYGYRPSSRGLITVNLDTLAVSNGAPLPAQSDVRPGTFSAELPSGWRAIWPHPPADTMDWNQPSEPVDLINMVTGEELTTPPIAVDWPRRECERTVPSELPSGRRPGQRVRTLEGGVEHDHWAQGDDVVRVSVGITPIDLVGPEEVEIRGTRGWLMVWNAADRPTATPIPVIFWMEGDCSYLLTLPIGMTHEQAREYASRF